MLNPIYICVEHTLYENFILIFFDCRAMFIQLVATKRLNISEEHVRSIRSIYILYRKNNREQ